MNQTSYLRSNLKLVDDHRNSDLTEKYIKEKQAEERETKAKLVSVNKSERPRKARGLTELSSPEGCQVN